MIYALLYKGRVYSAQFKYLPRLNMTASFLFKIIIILLLLAILISLASGLFFMIKDRGQTSRAVTSLTFRITISIALFVMLFVGYVTGLVKPHGIVPPQTEKALPQATPSP
jgi:succinate dehydrogenase hydrophobic anchor subunit